MTTGHGEGRFQPRPRRAARRRAENDAENLRGELVRILRRTEIVSASERKDFSEGSPVHDVASMVIIRLAALLERPEFAISGRRLTSEETVAIRTTRNIAAHTGYVGMNDDLFWTAVTTRVPAIIHRLLDDDPH
ncbi:antitoxin [Citricoccus sp. NPDC079358]|jgi:hypothetical protein|uniref:antitoxin n=1 Tax=Citricoccus sp. NPDC079358 TaxID=3154653 RepID=UPI00344FB738